jgi:hypothetical protein
MIDEPGTTGSRRFVMTANGTRRLPISRRVLCALPVALLVYAHERGLGLTRASSVEREPIATVERADGLTPPLTLAIARVVLRPGATAWAATPAGARMIAVESGVLAVASPSAAERGLTPAELAISAPEPSLNDELFVPAGTTIAFGGHRVASVRNPGSRSVVALDVVVHHEEPRPIARAFTTDDGVSFQLLASANAATAPPGRLSVVLEQLRLGAHAELPADLRVGLTLACVRAGAIVLSPVGGEVYAARAAASAPYSMPGELQPIAIGETREVTAGGVIFLPLGAKSEVRNLTQRPADLLTLAVREIA